ncbi:TetR family transcriptional regulator C-terminal domain-containing protein [Kitasatospora purpeofusca]|uniref:TetR family transcriptional regulator C-terminal domain-containing protein n=1 Tax=Kitasatospora purpeofusca TaxID=67352 RepID=UPI0037F4BF87
MAGPLDDLGPDARDQGGDPRQYLTGPEQGAAPSEQDEHRQPDRAQFLVGERPGRGAGVRLVGPHGQHQRSDHRGRRAQGRIGERVRDRVRATGPSPAPRDIVEAVLLEAVPTDRESLVFHLLHTEYAVLSVTDPALGGRAFLAAPDEMEGFLVGQLEAAQRSGDADPRLDARQEAALLLAASAGLGLSVLLGQRTPDDAVAALRYHLGRLFTAP